MNRDDDIFAEVLALAPGERKAFLDRACAGDNGRRARLEALLAADKVAGDFLERPLTPPLAVALFEQAGQRIGRYTLREKIGEGGCGVVWLAEQTEPVKRRVALKVIKLGMDTREVIARFEAERQALALMDHPNIAKVFDAGTTESGRPFFVMELVRGVPITRYCDEARLSTEARLSLFIEVCQAIQHAHQKGVIHRDIKPSNILVTLHDDRAVPKVIDFGIAKATQGRLADATVYTAFAQFIGTPAYMSPEQAEFNALDVDTRSDVYSLGVLLYELITGQPPFDPKSLASAGLDEIRRVIREVEPPRPSMRLTTVADPERGTLARQRGIAPAQHAMIARGDLDWIAMRCLEKNRTRRYETASALAVDLRRHLNHEPVAARPPSAIYTLQKLVRRHRLVFGAAAAVVVALIIGAGVSIWQMIRATRAEDVAWQAVQEQTRMREIEGRQRQRAESAELAARRRAYAADMNLVQQFLAVENFGQARELLDRHRPKSGERDLRGWEWRYLWQFCQTDARSVLTRKEDTSINSLAVSADGNWLAAGEEKYGNLSVWNLRTNEEIRIPAGKGPVRVAFSPGEPLLAIAMVAETEPYVRVRLWDVNTRQTVREILPGPGRAPWTVMAFSGDGKTLVTSGTGAENQIAFWRVADGKKIDAIPVPVELMLGNRWTSFAITRDMALAAVRVPHERVQVIDLKAKTELWSASSGTEGFTALAFSPDGKMLAAGGSSIRLWDARTGAVLGRFDGERRPVRHLVFLPDGKLASGGADQVVRIWDVATRRLLRSLKGHTTELNCLAVLPDNRTLVSGAKDGAIMFWDSMADRQAPGVVTIPGDPLAWRFSDASDAIIAADATGRVTERRGKDFEKATTRFEIGSDVTGAIMADECPLLAGTFPTHIRIWDWARGIPVQNLTFAKGENALAIQFTEKGAVLLIRRTHLDRTIWLEEWEVATGRPRRAWKMPTSDPFTQSASPDGKYVITAANHGRFIRMAMDESYPDALIRIELATGREVSLPALTREMRAGARFSPDSMLAIAPSLRGFADVIDTASWRRIATLSGGMSALHSTAFSPDGARLATGCTGMLSMMLWDVGSYERLLALGTTSVAIDKVAFSKDGNMIGISGSGNPLGGTERGALYFWRAPSRAEIEAAENAAKFP